jgi:anti-repressor protein|nr:MAG TPA: repressor domain protein [Bacteriophage sp.]
MDLQIFNNEEFEEIRTVTKDDEPMFCLIDICKALEIRNATDVAKRLDEDELTRLNLGSRAGETNFITESGLYAVILRSDKPNAKKFRKWVTSEVLPSIRKNGGYIAGQETLSDEELMAKALLVANNKIAERDKIIEQKQARIEQMKPKEIFADAVATSHTSILVGDLAKLICQNGYQIGQKRLFDWLRANGYLIKTGSSYNMPMQRYVEQGLFEIKESNLVNPDGSVRITKTTKVTGKGQIYFVNKFLKGAKNETA